MSKVNLDTIKPWVNEKITQILGFEDDVVIEFIFNQLEETVRDHSPVIPQQFSYLCSLLENEETLYFWKMEVCSVIDMSS